MRALSAARARTEVAELVARGAVEAVARARRRCRELLELEQGPPGRGRGGAR